MRDKIVVEGDRMSVVDASFAEVRRKGLFLIEWEFRGPGDTIPAACDRAERKFGAPATFLQRLWSRDVKDALFSNCARVVHAYDQLCAEIERQAEHQVELAEKAGVHAGNSRLLKMAARLGGQEVPSALSDRRGRA